MEKARQRLAFLGERGRSSDDIDGIERGTSR
jgi:hypothetical protein